MVAALLAGPAHAHEGSLFPSIDWVWLVLITCAVLYVAGVRKLWRRPRIARGLPIWRVTCVGAGWLSLAAALSPPLESLSQISFAAHMMQHELLMLVAAPLLVLGKPLAAFVWGLPPRGRQRVSRPFQSARLLVHGFPRMLT